MACHTCSWLFICTHRLELMNLMAWYSRSDSYILTGQEQTLDSCAVLGLTWLTQHLSAHHDIRSLCLSLSVDSNLTAAATTETLHPCVKTNIFLFNVRWASKFHFLSIYPTLLWCKHSAPGSQRLRFQWRRRCHQQQAACCPHPWYSR